MTEYTREEGSLTTNKDVIQAAAKLFHYGTQLRERASPIADECTDRILSEQLRDHVAKIDPLQVGKPIHLIQCHPPCVYKIFQNLET